MVKGVLGDQLSSNVQALAILVWTQLEDKCANSAILGWSHCNRAVLLLADRALCDCCYSRHGSR